MFTVFSWTVSILLGLAAWGFMKLVTRPIRRSMTGRDAQLDDNLKEFGGSYGADRVLGPVATESVVQLYERMCILEPSKWESDPRIDGVVKAYKDIVSGKVADPDGRNVPSSEILGSPNPDYALYLKNQRKILGQVKGLKTALKWSVKAQKEEEIRGGFADALLNMGMSERLVPYAVTDERLDTYDDAQWKAVVKAMRIVSEKYSEDLAVDMLVQFVEPEILCSAEAAETFDALCREDIPFEVSTDVVRGKITVEQAEQAAGLVEDWGYEWKDAVAEVLEKNDRELNDAALRHMYAKRVNPRAKARG